MKFIYICEECGKEYTEAHQAIGCETTCKILSALEDKGYPMSFNDVEGEAHILEAIGDGFSWKVYVNPTFEHITLKNSIFEGKEETITTEIYNGLDEITLDDVASDISDFIEEMSTSRLEKELAELEELLSEVNDLKSNIEHTEDQIDSIEDFIGIREDELDNLKRQASDLYADKRALEDKLSSVSYRLETRVDADLQEILMQDFISDLELPTYSPEDYGDCSDEEEKGFMDALRGLFTR